MNSTATLILLSFFIVLGVGYTIAILQRKKQKQNTGTALRQAATDTSEEYQKFKLATAKDPNNPNLWVQWGNALDHAAQQSRSQSMKRLRYNEACACYMQATTIAENHTQAWVNWGKSLYELAALQRFKDILLLEGGHNKFKTAITVAPQTLPIWDEWAKELEHLLIIAPTDQRPYLQELFASCQQEQERLSAIAPETEHLEVIQLIGTIQQNQVDENLDLQYKTPLLLPEEHEENDTPI